MKRLKVERTVLCGSSRRPISDRPKTCVGSGSQYIWVGPAIVEGHSNLFLCWTMLDPFCFFFRIQTDDLHGFFSSFLRPLDSRLASFGCISFQQVPWAE